MSSSTPSGGKPVLLVCLLFCATAAFAQDGGGGSNPIWLPLKFETSLRPVIEQIVAHAITRKPCRQLLDARLAHRSAPDDPKFIVNCLDSQNQNLNLVYHQSDVLSQFRHINYAGINEPDAIAQGLPLAISLTDEEVELARSSCKNALREHSREGKIAVLVADDEIIVNRRKDSKLSIFLDYHTGGPSPELYTATCIITRGGSLRIDTFPR